MRSSGSWLTPSSVFSTNSRNRGPSSGGKPSMSAITRIGMCWAYSLAASMTARSPNASMREWQNALVAGSCLATAALVNAGSSSLRASWWNGGAEEIGGAPPPRAPSAGGPEVAHDDRPRGEVVGVVGDRRHVLVAGRQPAAAEALGVRDRASLAQLVLDRVGIGRPLRLEVREVRRPVGDRPGDDLVAGAERLFPGRVAEVLGEAVVDAHVIAPPAR